MKRKNRRKKSNRLILVLLLLIFILSVILVIKQQDKKETVDTSKELQQNEVEVNEPDEPSVSKEKTTSMSLIMVGDNLIHESVYKDAQRHANGSGYDFRPMITRIKEKVQNYDLAYYNQETILGGTELNLSGYPTFNSPYEAGDYMIDAGFNLVSTATNHALDKGEKGILNSRKYWNEQKDVLVAGTYSSKEQRDEIQIKEKNGITYTMLNYTYGTNGSKVPTGKDYLINVWPTDLSINDPKKDKKYQAYKEKVKQDIAKVRDKVDVLIVAMHCGVEYKPTASSYQKDEAEFLASEGVDIVIGTHPHVIEPVEWIDDTIVFYSLGNFISSQYRDDNYNKLVGLMSSLNITKTTNEEESVIKIDKIENELIYTSYKNEQDRSNIQVIPFSHPNIAKYLPKYESVYETYKKVVQSYDKSMYVVPAYVE